MRLEKYFNKAYERIGWSATLLLLQIGFRVAAGLTDDDLYMETIDAFKANKKRIAY